MSEDEIWRMMHLKEIQEFFKLNHKYIVYEPNEEIARIYQDEIPERFRGIWYSQEEAYDLKVTMIQARLPGMKVHRYIIFNETDRFIMRDDGEVARIWELKFQ
jgi:hypothetical protein